MATKIQNKKPEGQISQNSRSGKIAKIEKGGQSKKEGRKSLSKNLRVGDVCELKISALGANHIGIDEFSYPYAVFVPNAKYGSVVKAKVLKMTKSASSPATQTMYVVAQMLEEIKQPDNSNPLPVNAGDVLTVSIQKEMSYGKGLKTNRAGVVDISPNFQLIIPLSLAFPTFSTEGGKLPSGGNVKVLVTRVKEKYAFAKVVDSSFKKKSTEVSGGGQISSFSLEAVLPACRPQTQNAGTSLTSLNSSVLSSKLTFASKLTTTLPKNCQKYGKYVVLKIKDSVLFVKVQKGVNLGDKVRIKVTSSSNNCAIGKVLQVNPMSKNQKTALVLNSVRDMINHGLHFGQKAVRCHARMKNYIWLKKQSSTVGTVGMPTLPVGSAIFGKIAAGGRSEKAGNFPGG